MWDAKVTLFCDSKIVLRGRRRGLRGEKTWTR